MLDAVAPVPLATSVCGPINLVPTCKVDINHWRGDSLSLLIRVWDDDAHTVPSDLSSATVTADLKVKNTDEIAVDTFGISISGNDVTLSLTPAQSRAMPPKTVWDCQIDWYSDDARVTTVVTGTLTENQDVTW